jgi:S-adenosylmethionine synthetase
MQHWNLKTSCNNKKIMEERFFTVRSVEEGQSDRLSDLVSEAVLDGYLKIDPETKADIRVLINKHSVKIFGEVTSSANPDIEKIVRQVLKEIGYEDSITGIDPYKCTVNVDLQRQSQDIARSLHPQDGDEIPASDTGVIYGYANNEDINFLPIGYNLAMKLSERLTFVRKSSVIEGLLPDGQVAVTMEYLHDKPMRISSVILASHHRADIDLDWLRMELTDKVVNSVCKKYLDSNSKILINPGGRFVIGGPAADVGMSGRRVENETYCGFTRYGGLSFSGRDPLKINRTVALKARMAAIDVVRKRMCDKVELYIGYAFGVINPICLDVETFGTSMYDEREIIDYINMNYNFGITSIIRDFDLMKPIYKELSLNGYWGNISNHWEKFTI